MLSVASCLYGNDLELPGHPVVAVLYLDIDDTVRLGPSALGRFVHKPEDVRIYPEAVKRMKDWKSAGGRIVGISNQGGIALDLVSQDDVLASMVETQRQANGLFDNILWCPHHPSSFACMCRKPAIGMLVQASLDMRCYGESYPISMALFVGDRPEDEQCADNAGIDFMYASSWRAGVV